MNMSVYGPSYGRNYSFLPADGFNGSSDGSWNVTANSSRDSHTDLPLSWKMTHRLSSYAFVITMLSITVVMATMFTLFGLFMKAEAHKSSEDHHGGTGGGGGGASMYGDITGNDDYFMKSIDADME